MAYPFFQNGLLKTRIKTFRILWIPTKHDDLALIDIFDSLAVPIWASCAKLLQDIDKGDLDFEFHDALAQKIKADQDLTVSERKIRDRRWDSIRRIVEDPRLAIFSQDTSGEVVHFAAEEWGPPTSEFGDG